MPHIPLPDGLPGIIGPLARYPETAAPLLHLAQTLLRGESPLTAAERETIAAYVSSLNSCSFCMNSHKAAAEHLLGPECSVVTETLAGPESAEIGEQMKALLAIAAKVQQGGRAVTVQDVARARLAGAGDKAIHDTVLIAAAFCMFNRYVDGLATAIPPDEAYTAMGARLAAEGYGSPRSS